MSWTIITGQPMDHVNDGGTFYWYYSCGRFDNYTFEKHKSHCEYCK